MADKLNFKLVFDSAQLRPIDVECFMLDFEREMLRLEGVERVPLDPAAKDIDPLAFATLALSLAPSATTGFFEFLNAWTMRRQHRMVRVKIQLGRNKSLEFEGSETLSAKDVERWIATIKKGLSA